MALYLERFIVPDLLSSGRHCVMLENQETIDSDPDSVHSDFGAL